MSRAGLDRHGSRKSATHGSRVSRFVNKAMRCVVQLGAEAVAKLLPEYHEPSGPKPLRRWLTGLF